MDEEYAAVMLQCVFRGHKASTQFDKYIDMIAMVMKKPLETTLNKIAAVEKKNRSGFYCRLFSIQSTAKLKSTFIICIILHFTFYAEKKCKL